MHNKSFSAQPKFLMDIIIQISYLPVCNSSIFQTFNQNSSTLNSKLNFKTYTQELVLLTLTAGNSAILTVTVLD